MFNSMRLLSVLVIINHGAGKILPYARQSKQGNDFDYNYEYKTSLLEKAHPQISWTDLYLNDYDNKVTGKFVFTMSKVCPNKAPMDMKTQEKVQSCLESIPQEISILQFFFKNQYHDFSKQLCKAWPDIRRCLDPVFNYWDICYENKYIRKLVDRVVMYACSVSKQGLIETNVLADFMVYRNTCLTLNVYYQCVLDNFQLNTTSICPMIQDIKVCTDLGLEDCSSPKLHEIISRAIEEIYAEFTCDATE